jgi:hypothetical protein
MYTFEITSQFIPLNYNKLPQRSMGSPQPEWQGLIYRETRLPMHRFAGRHD